MQNKINVNCLSLSLSLSSLAYKSIKRIIISSLIPSNYHLNFDNGDTERKFHSLKYIYVDVFWFFLGKVQDVVLCMSRCPAEQEKIKDNVNFHGRSRL